MKTNLTLAMILLLSVSACATNPPAGPTIDVSASETLAQETAIAGVNGTATANAPTATPQPSATPRPTATDTPTPTPLPTYTPLPELPPNAIDLQWITAYGLPGVQDVLEIHPTRDGGFILLGFGVVLKLRADGLIEWQTSLGQWAVRDVFETSTGDFILAADLHWIKLDSLGNLLWEHTLEGPSYLTGPILRFVEESNGDIVVEAVGSRTVFNADGEIQSSTADVAPSDSYMSPDEVRDLLEENQFEYVFFIHTTADGGALVGTIVYEDYGDVASILSHVEFSRFSEDGSLRWRRGHGGYFLASYDNFHAMETKSGDIIIAGTLTFFANQVDRIDVWALRLGQDGNSRWDKLYATEGKDPRGLDAVAVIQELSNGHLLFAGQTSGAGTGGQDMWVLKTNAQGEIPNCGLVFDGSVGLFGSFPEVPTPEPVQVPIGQDGPHAIPLCPASP